MDLPTTANNQHAKIRRLTERIEHLEAVVKLAEAATRLKGWESLANLLREEMSK